MAEAHSPALRRLELGALLRALRNAKGLTVEQVAERLLCSPSKVSRMETGQGATARDIRDLCDLYGVADAAERDRLMHPGQGRQAAGAVAALRPGLCHLRRAGRGGSRHLRLPVVCRTRPPAHG